MFEEVARILCGVLPADQITRRVDILVQPEAVVGHLRLRGRASRLALLPRFPNPLDDVRAVPGSGSFGFFLRRHLAGDAIYHFEPLLIGICFSDVPGVCPGTMGYARQNGAEMARCTGLTGIRGLAGCAPPTPKASVSRRRGRVPTVRETLRRRPSRVQFTVDGCSAAHAAPPLPPFRLDLGLSPRQAGVPNVCESRWRGNSVPDGGQEELGRMLMPGMNRGQIAEKNHSFGHQP